MDGVKIFHIADAHLDAPFSGMSPIEAASSKNALRSAFSKAVLAAKNRGVQLFFIAGDLFDGDFVSPDTEEFLYEKLASYPQCRFFIAPGNHDPYTDGSFYAKKRLPENVHVFKEKERVEIDELGVDVYGCGFTAGECTESPITGYPELRRDRINILVCHGDAGNESSPYGPISLKELERSGFDYVALGHIHKGSGLMKAGDVCYAYPGCIEGRGFDECGDKGGLFGTVEKGGAELGHFSLSVKRYEICKVDISGAESRLQVLDAIRSAIKPYSGTRLRVVLTGNPKDAFYIDASAFSVGGSDPDYIEIADKSVPRPDLTAIEAENTLRGAFFRSMTERYKFLPEGSREREVCLKALKAGLAALDGRDPREV